MLRLLANLIAPLLPALIPLALFAACATTPADQAREACEAAAEGDMPQAREAADAAFEKIDRLPLDAICRLAASYAVIALTTGDEQAADRFQTAYSLSVASDSTAANRFYNSLDPQMADGLRIIAGLLDGRGIYTDSPAALDQDRDLQVRTALAED